MPRAIVSALVLLLPLAASAKEPIWVTDFAEAKTAAKLKDRPIFLVLRCER